MHCVVFIDEEGRKEGKKTLTRYERDVSSVKSIVSIMPKYLGAVLPNPVDSIAEWSLEAMHNVRDPEGPCLTESECLRAAFIGI